MRPEKANIVSEVQEKLKQSPFLLLADYSGMQVRHFEELRTRLGGAVAECHVVKNSFVKRAAKDLGLPDLSESLTGQTVMITGEGDICSTAKILKAFVSEFEKPAVRVGVLDNALLTAEEVNVLADLPSEEVLRATLLGVLLAPATKLVRVLNEPGTCLARVLKAKAELTEGA